MVEGTDETVASETIEEAHRPIDPLDPLGRGELAGRYVVLGVLGAGGMGVVYAAYDPELDRKVALKLLRADRARGERATTAHARLVREAQAMARLSHPNVIAVHDVGSLDDQVFIAMEFVDGRTLGAWAGEEQHQWREVVDVYTRAGRGLAAAHAKGLVHRDFKPDNVLVGHDGRVRVMDFGLARPEGHEDATGGDAAVDAIIQGRRDSGESTPMTRTGAVLGTPAYMAPEQHLGLATDARTDQFSFCVALYESLYGERPFGGDTMASLAFQVTEGKVREAPKGTGVPGWLRRTLERGLATVPDERFATMDELLTALGQGQATARTGRVLAVVGVLAVLGAGAEGYRRYDVAGREAACDATGDEVLEAWSDERRQQLRAGLLATGASYASTTTQKVMPWLDEHADAWRAARVQACLDANVRGVSDPDTLDRSLWCLDERLMQLGSLVDELTRADAKVVQKAVKAAAGLSSLAPCGDRGVLARLAAPPGENREQIRGVREQVTRAGNLTAAGRYDEAAELARAALEQARALSWSPLLAAAGYRLGHLLQKQGDYAEAERVLEDAYFEASTGAAPEVMADAAVQLVHTVGFRSARHAEGRRWSRHAEVALAVVSDGESLREADLLQNLAHVDQSAGTYDEAKALYERSLGIKKNALGPEHPRVAAGLTGLANTHFAMGAHDEARALHESALAIWEQALGTDHPDVGYALNNLATVQWSTGAYEEARALYERALVVFEAALGSDHPNVSSILNNLALIHQTTGDYAEAKGLHERVLPMREKALGPDHPDVAKSLNNLAAVHSATGSYAEAKALHERALAIREKALGPEHADVAGSLNNIAIIEQVNGNRAEARALYERALAIQEGALGAEHPALAHPLQGLAVLALEQGRAAQAVPFAERGVAVRVKGKAAAELVAELRFVLAKALWKAPPGRGGDRARAVTIATKARDAYRDAKGKAKELGEVEAWLAKHGGSR